MKSKKQTAKLDILNGSIWNKIPLYALPVAATGILEQLFNASDIAIVGNFASTDRTVAIAAVGANSPVIGDPESFHRSLPGNQCCHCQCYREKR